MSVKSNKEIETNKYELEIEISPESFEAAIEKAYQSKKKSISVPGFRKGKATRKIIEKEYGEGVFYEDAVNALVPGEVDTAVAEAGFELVTRPDVEVVSIDREKGLEIKVTCITKPEVKIEKYKGLETTKNVKAVTEEDIDKDIDNLRQKGMRIIDIDDRPCQNGDDVVIDFEGYQDGVPFEGGKAEKFTLSLGSGQFIPGFEEQVCGHSIGDEFDINVTFPEEYGAENLAGKDAVFKIRLHEIKAKELPTLDDDFVKDTTEFDTVEQLREDVKRRLEEAEEKKADSEVESALFDQIIDSVEGEIPEVMYENRVEEMIQDMTQRLAPQGISLDMYLQYTGSDMDTLRKTYREQAEKQVKLRLALEQIAKEESIEVSDEETEQEFSKMADNYKMDVEQVKSYVTDDALKKDLAVAKAAELVKNSAKIK